MRYILKRASGSDKWGVYDFGTAASTPSVPCDRDFNEVNVIVCQLYHYFRFDRETARFMIVYLAGYTNGEDADSDTPFIAIGKCSAI
jgi:hypothetical protein